MSLHMGMIFRRPLAAALRLLGPFLLLLAVVMAARPGAAAPNDPQDATAVSFIYWTDQTTGSNNGEIWRSLPDGTGTAAPLVTGLQNPRGISLDKPNNQMYWVDRAADRLQRATLDGGNVTNFCSGMNGPDDMKLDLESRWVYWSEPIQNRIRRSPLSNCNPQSVLDAADGLGDAVGIALDLQNDQIYWAEFGAQRVRRANLDGSNVQTLISSGLGGPLEIALDVANGHMYFVDSPISTPGYGGRVLRASLSGTNVTQVGPELDNPRGLALDLAAGHIYVIDTGTKSLKRWDMNGQNVVTLKSGGVTMSDPRAVALDLGGGGGPTCYTLSRQRTGNGSNPQATPGNSTGCPNNQYTAGASISVEADPDPNWSVGSWNGTTNNDSTATINTVSMPAGNHTVTVNYVFDGEPCYVLERQHTGQGSNPTASPGNSPGCPSNQYTAGATISLSAVPSAGWTVTGWSGTANNNSTATNNTVSMPANHHTVIVHYGLTCYALDRQHTGQGSNPTANPANSTGCPTGQYSAGTGISLSADPAAGWTVTGWSGTANNNSTTPTNSVVMPANNHTVIVHYGLTCYTLLRQHTGQGSDPVATPGNSTGCPTGQYTAGAQITLSATPAAGWVVGSWSGTVSDGATTQVNTVTMPAGHHTAIVNYVLDSPCYTLTRDHIGQGGDPIASPPSSGGCGLGQYKAEAVISLTADPALEWRVVGWNGTIDNNSTATTNTVIMPASNHTVSVTYAPAPCYALNQTHEGQGSTPAATPTQSEGCDPNTYHEGAVIALSADPAPGWEMAGWSGTIDNNSTATSNVAIMPAAAHEVKARYQLIPTLAEHLYLPSTLFVPAVAPSCDNGPNEHEPNNGFSQATANGPFCLGVDFLGQPTDQWDVFVFDVEVAGTLTVRVENHRGQDALLRLHNAAHDTLASDPHAADGFQVSHGVTPGRYFVSLFVNNPNVNETERYTLRAVME